jgi:hypothetical protein
MKGSRSSRLHIEEKNILNKISDEYDGRCDAFNAKDCGIERKMYKKYESSSFLSAKNLRVDSDP